MKKIMSKFMGDSVALTIGTVMGIDANDGFIVLSQKSCRTVRHPVVRNELLSRVL